MHTYIITGATGYIASALVNHLQKSRPEAKIIAPVRNLKRAYQLLPKTVECFECDLMESGFENKIPDLGDESVYILHCASVTQSSYMVSNPVETIESIVNITQNIMKLSRACRAKSVVYLSSMEVYGNMDCSDGHRVSENELGEVDIFNVRSCYPLGKRMAEHICYSYFKEYGVPVKIVRLAQTFGHGIFPEDNRVFAQFARAVKNETDIVLHTAGNSVGNYCSIDDAVAGILFILGHGTNGEAYNVVNEENSMTIRQMAELVAENIAEGKIRVVYDIPEGNPYGYAPGTGIRLSGKKLEKLGWKAKDNLIKMYREICNI